MSLRNKSIIFVFTTDRDIEVKRHIINAINDYKIPCWDIPDGCYYLNLYYEGQNERIYWSYLRNRSIALRIQNGHIQFIESPTTSENRRIINGLPVDIKTIHKYLQPSSLSQSNATEIQSLANSITRFKITPMQKVLAIHDWVASNVYYDIDALHSGKSNMMAYTALDVLREKKCVCRGYANLGVALMRAAGIPAIGLHCYALNIDSGGGWERIENQTNIPNHIIAVAYVGRRWTLMDITWDSDNSFVDNKFQRITGMGTSRKYFDSTLEMISNTHKFILDF